MQKSFSKIPLTFEEIVIGADLATLQAALEARQKIDGLLLEREEAYRKIAELENQINSIIGVPGSFVFPAPPVAIAPVAKIAPSPKTKPEPESITAKEPKEQASPKTNKKSK